MSIFSFIIHKISKGRLFNFHFTTTQSIQHLQLKLLRASCDNNNTQQIFWNVARLILSDFKVRSSIFSIFLILSSKQVLERFSKLDVDEEVHEEVGQVVDEDEVVRQTWQRGSRKEGREQNWERQCENCEDAQADFYGSRVRTETSLPAKINALFRIEYMSSNTAIHITQ